jgi:hypothetical protein
MSALPVLPDAALLDVWLAIRAITEARLHGKPKGKKRPATLIRVTQPENPSFLKINPKVWSGRGGWEVGSPALVVLFTSEKCQTGEQRDFRRLTATLRSDGSCRLKSWFRSSREKDEATLYQLLEALAADPLRALNGRSEHCALCGKGFTDDSSKLLGIGPECIKTWRAAEAALKEPELKSAMDRARELRRAMQAAHPDRGGTHEAFIQASADWELFKRSMDLPAQGGARP